MMINYQSIYRKDHKANLRIFSDLKAIKEFSSYANDLNRVFGDNSYNQFHKNLSEPKQIMGDNFFNLFQNDKTKNKTRLKIFEEQFNLKQFEESLANMKSQDKLLQEKIKYPYIERMKNSRNYLLKKEIERNKLFKQNKSLKSFPEVPDVGRYNPQYNSVNKHSYRAFFGNMPTNRFNTIEHEIIKNDKNNIESINDKEKEKNISHKFIIKTNLFNRKNNNTINNHFFIKKIIENNNQLKNNNDNKNNNEYNNSIKENKTEKIFNIKNSNNISLITDNNSNNNSFSNNIGDKSIKSKNNSSIEEDKNSLNKSKKSKYKNDNNHCLRFETYTSRKPLNKTIIYNTDIRTELPNYYTSKYIKNNINFKKNKNTPNYIEQAIMRDQNPPLGFYQPKYSLVFNNIDKNIYMYKKNLSNLTNNRIKKIFCDYNISKDYQTVPSLNNVNIENRVANTESNIS